MRLSTTLSLLTCLLFCGALSAEERIGFEDTFDSTDGWKHVRGAAPESFKANGDGTVTLQTIRGTLNFRGGLAESVLKLQPATTTIQRDYAKKIDFNKYRYLVTDLPERATMCKMYFCTRWIPALYTSGLRVTDLHAVGIRGHHNLKITIEFHNTHNKVTFNNFRLVSSLNEEEKKALVPPPIGYYQEKLKIEPDHNLDAANRRAGRYHLKQAENQALVYRDTATNAEVMRLTDQPGDQTFNEGDRRIGWAQQGRLYQVGNGRNGKHFYDYRSASWSDAQYRLKNGKPLTKYHNKWESVLHPRVVYGYRVNWGARPIHFTVYKFEIDKGEESKIGEFKYDTKNGKFAVIELARGGGDTVVIGLREAAQTYVINPDLEPSKRIKSIVLPSNLKGVHLSDDNKEIIWNTCYTYERWRLDIASMEKRREVYVTWSSHSGGGFGKYLGQYEGGLLLSYPNTELSQAPGDQVKIVGNWKNPIRTDYGGLIDKGDWWLVNGNGGDVNGQHLLINMNDSATVLRIVGYNTSRNSWSTNTYSMASPDATKISWMSDQLGSGEVYTAVARHPDPVRELMVKQVGSKVDLRWQAPERCTELAGYAIYAAGADDQFTLVQNELHAATNWTGEVPKGATRFMVAAREWSGLEARLSQVARLKNDNKSGIAYLDVSDAERSATARLVFDGSAAGARCVRAFKASDNETEDALLTWRKPEAFAISQYYMRIRDDKQGSQWRWEKARVDDKGKTVSFKVHEGVLIDRLLISNKAGFKPQLQDDRFAEPATAQVKAQRNAAGEVTFTWNKPTNGGIARLDIYTGTDNNFYCDNQSVVGSILMQGSDTFVDWGAEDTVYKCIVVSTRGMQSKPVVVTPTPPQQARTITIKAADVSLDGGAELKQKEGIACIAPKAGNGLVAVTYTFEVAADGNYDIWSQYIPGYTKKLKVAFAIDGQKKQEWRMRAPYRDIYGGPRGIGKAFIFGDRVQSRDADRYALKAGQHSITFYLDASIEKGQVHHLGEVYVSSDPAFRPASYNPRADFVKAAKAK